MSTTTTTTTTTTTMAPEAKTVTTKFDGPVRLRGAPQTFASLPEPTPEISRRPALPDALDIPLRPSRRFAPQLVDTSRRCRRDGDLGVRSTEKTDVTPYTRNKYANLRPRAKRRPASRGVRSRAGGDETGGGGGQRGPARGDEFLLELATRRAERDALDVFPNSRPREGGAAHFYFRDSDDDETSASESRPSPASTRQNSTTTCGGGGGGGSRRRGAGLLRRKSTDLGWWHRVMQEHAEDKVREWQDGARCGMTDYAADMQDVESDPECGDDVPEWIHEVRRRGSVTMECHPPSAAPQEVVSVVSEAPLVAPRPRAPPREKLGGVIHVVGDEKEVDAEFEVMRRAASPPMLGGDIVFPRCESPEVCRISTDLPFTLRASEEKRRDPTQKLGLWGGYCFNPRKEEQPPSPSPLDPNNLTPPSGGGGLLWSGSRNTPSARPPTDAPSPPPSPVGSGGGMWSSTIPKPTPPPSQGLSPFQNIRRPAPEEQTAAAARPALEPEARERRIDSEFTDAFVTQVYNYLSLGCPATARDFDAELCAATGVSEEEITREDARTMERGGRLCGGAEAEECPAERRSPRWKALRAYVRGWAVGQEDLDVSRPGPWAVGGRGSWRT